MTASYNKSTNSSRARNYQKIVITGLMETERFLHEFEEAAKPIKSMLQQREGRLQFASEKSLPYILNDIKDLSDGLANLEALFGVLSDNYLRVKNSSIFLEKKWKGASAVMIVLKEALLEVNIDPVMNGEIIAKIQKLSI